MAWPTTVSGTLTSGIAGQGAVTTLRWGTNEAVTLINGSTVSGIGVTTAIVTRFNERAIVENIKLTNGAGVTTSRIQIQDGVQWDITIRDDTGMTGSVLPKIGNTVTLVDAAGIVAGSPGTAYAGTVVETGYDAAPKQPGERTITVEKLRLVETASWSGA